MLQNNLHNPLCIVEDVEQPLRTKQHINILKAAKGGWRRKISFDPTIGQIDHKMSLFTTETVSLRQMHSFWTKRCLWTPPANVCLSAAADT